MRRAVDWNQARERLESGAEHWLRTQNMSLKMLRCNIYSYEEAELVVTKNGGRRANSFCVKSFAYDVRVTLPCMRNDSTLNKEQNFWHFLNVN